MAARCGCGAEPTNLSALAGELVQHLGVLAEEKQQMLILETPECLIIPIDPLVLRQALSNLLDNAIKYSPEGSTIRIVVADLREHITLEVIDGGPGIAPEHQDRIFDRFYRIDKARSRQLGGVGTWPVHHPLAVEVHGGKIEVQSREGQGSHFIITLPTEV